MLQACSHATLAKVFDPEILLAKGYEARRENLVEEARDLFAQAVAESKWIPDLELRAKALEALGQVERDLKHPDSALKHYREAAELHRKHGQMQNLAHCIRHLADILREQKSLPESETAYSEALAIYRSQPETTPLALANLLRGYALLRDAAGDEEQALLFWMEASHLYEAAGVAAGVAECKSQIAFMTGR